MTEGARAVKRVNSDSGAVAVEFALVMIPLMMILLGVIDFGRAYSQQLTLTEAARVGARIIAVQNNPTAAAGSIEATAAGAGMTRASGLSFDPLPACPTGAQVPGNITVTVSYPLTSLTGWFDSLFSGEHLTGKGVMRCGG